MEDKRKILYNQLSKDYDLGDFDSFSAKLDDETKRKAFYDAVSKDYDLGDYNSFVTKISAAPQSETTEVANKPYTHKYDDKGNLVGGTAYEKQVDSGAIEPEEKKVEHIANVNWSNPIHDWKTDEQKTIEEISRSGNATIAKDEQGNEYYPVKPMEVAFDEGLQQEKKRIQALATVGEQLDQRIKANEEALKEAFKNRNKRLNDNKKGFFESLIESQKNYSLEIPEKLDLAAFSNREEEISNLVAEKEYLEEAKKVFEAAKNDAGFFRGMKDAVDVSFLTFGMSDLQNAKRIKAVQQKLESGQPLSESEQSLLTSLGLQQVVNEQYNELLGRWYKAGMTTADMVPFMAEMAVNPLSGLGKSAMKASVKKFGEKGVKAVTTKILSRAIGDAAGAAGMAVTTGMPSVMADALERQQGYVTTDTSSGVVEGVGLAGGESASDAWRKAITSRTIENWSEMVGNYFAPIGKTAGKITTKTLNALKLGKVNEIIDNINSSNLARILDDFTEQTQWNGSLGEFAEEQVGMIADALLVGDTKWSDITDLEQQLDVALGVGVFGSFMSLLRIGGYRTPKYRARKAVERADKDGLNVFGSEWEGIKELILASPDEELSANLASHTEFSTEQMKAALMYANALKAQQAVNTYKEKEKIDNPDDIGIEVEYTYDEGFETTESYLKHYAKRELDFAESELGVNSRNSDEQQFAQMVMAGADSPVESINAMAEQGYSEEQIQKAKDYYTAYHRMNGITDALIEDIDSQIDSANNEVDANTNQENGSVTKVVLRNGGVGYVVQGTVVRSEDGTVDVNNSDDVIFVRLENGETKMMNPNKDLVGVVWMLAPETLKENNNTILKQILLDKAVGEIDWNPATPNPKVGDSFEMNGIQVTIVSHDNKGGMFVVPTEEYQTALGSEQKMQQLVAKAQQTQPIPFKVYKDWASAQLDAQEESANAQQTDANNLQTELQTEANMPESPTSSVADGNMIPENRPMSEEEANNFVSRMNDKAEPMPTIEFTPENWQAAFGDNGTIETPIGTVKMGENQISKLFLKKRTNEFGMIAPTLSNPDVIIEESSQSKDGNSERESSYLFVKTFIKDGQKIRYYTSVTVLQEGMEVSISSHVLSDKKVPKKLMEGNVIYIKEALSSNSSDGRLAEQPNAVPDLLPTQENNTSLSENKDKSNNVQSQENQGDFVSMGKEKAFEVLGNKYGEKMPRKVEVTAKALAEDLRKAQQKLDKAELDYDDAPIGREDKAEKALNKAREEFEAVKREADFWAEMDAEIKSAQVMPGDEAADEILSMEEPLNGLEFAAQMLANGNIKLLQESFMEETGFGREESKKYFGLFASKEKGGVSVERAGERLMEADREEGTNFFDQNDANAGRDAIIEILGIARTKSDLANYIKDNREKQARKEQAAEYAVYESWVEENFHMSIQDYEAYEEVIARELSERALTEEEYQEFMSTFVDETINNEQYEQQGIDSESEGSSEILPGTQSLQAERTGGIEEESAEVDGGIVGENGALPESSSGNEVVSQIEQARAEVDANPTDAQKEAGNYKKGHVKIDGFDITIENPKGGVRSGTDKNGKKWSITMNNDYGYIRGTEAVDGDHIDVFLSDNPAEGNVFVVDQSNEDGSFDESKVMYGFSSLEEARAAYLSNYEKGWESRIMAITEVSKDEFKKWIDSSHRKTKAFGEYKSVKAEAGQGYSIEASNVSRMEDIEARITEIENERIEIEGELENLGNSNPLASVELISQLDQLDREQSELEAEYSGLRSMNDESNAILEGEGSNLRFREQQAKEEKRRKPLRERAKEWSKKLGVKVKVMESLKDVTNASARRAIIMGETVTGWYEESTGEVCLYMPYLSSESEVDATYIHEVVAHKGLRGLLGDKFDEFCDQVWEMMSAADKAKFIRYPGVNGNTRAAADEYIAHLAETIDVSDSSWSKFTELIKKFLKAIGLEPKMTNADIANAIKRSYRRLAESGNAENVGGEGTRFRTLEEINQTFNEELQQQIDGTLPNGHIYQLGSPSAVLLSTGIADVPIELNSTRLEDKSKNFGHDYDLSELKDLVKAIHNPMAIFAYGDKNKAQNIIVEIQHEGKNFIVGLSIRPSVGGRVLDINSIRNVFPKDNAEWLNWISQGKMLYADKERIQNLINQQRTNLADVDYLDLDSIANIINSFENPILPEEKTLFRTVYHGSAAKFDKFNKDFIGSGEGQSVMGHGFYVTTSEGTSEYYANVASENKRKIVQEGGYTFNGEVVRDRALVSAYELLKDNNFDADKAIERANHRIEIFKKRKGIFANTSTTEKAIEYLEAEKNNPGSIGYQEEIVEKPSRVKYEVEIPDDTGKNYLDLDKKATKKFKDESKKRMIEVLDNGEEASYWKKNRDIINYEWESVDKNDATNDTVRGTMEQFISQEEVANIFSEMGYVGSKAKESDGTTYIIYNEDDIEIKDSTRFRVANQNQEFFVSNAQKAVEGIKQEKGTPQQWLAMIEKNGGMKAGEDKWLGLSDWLKASDKKSITKAEILDFIGENKIRIEEVHYGDANTNPSFESLKQEYDQWLREEGSDYAWNELIERFGDDAEIAFSDMGGELVVENEDAAATLLGGDNIINYTRLNYTTEGLENKHEIALTVPTIESWNEDDEIHFGDAGGGRAVAWIRFGETTDADGNRVLVIDEIQSKRHQEGREKGYKSKEIANLLKETEELQDKLYNEGLTEEEYERNREIRRRLEELSPGAGGYSNIPEAPFEKNWHELAMKRMLRYAAENGYDKVAWTTGEQQADRYNLSNVVERIQIKKFDDGYDVYSYAKDTGALIEHKTYSSEKELSDSYGQALAAELIKKDAANKTDNYVSVEGDGLKVGGEGMKGFYDKMLPSFVSKYVKKWGAKVQDIELPNVEEAGRIMHSVDVTDAMKESVMEGQTMFRVTKAQPKNEVEVESDEDLQRKGEGPLTADEVSLANDPLGKVLGQPTRTAGQRKSFAQRERQRMVERVTSLAKKLGLKNVEIVTDASTLSGAQRKAKGFYSKSKRKITIVIPNHSSVFDAEQTLLHEAVGHYGLRELFGNHFDTFLNNVYKNASSEVRERINRLAMKNGWDFQKATEEYLASLAEDTNFEDMQESWWSKIKEYFLQMLHDIGFIGFRGVTLTDNELRYILWRSYENLAEPGRYRSILGEAADIAMQDKLKVGNYSQSKYERERLRLLASGLTNSSVAESAVPYTHKEQIEDLVEEFTSLYNSVPVHILDKNVSDKQLQEWTGMEDITTEELIDWMEKQKVPALHVRTNDNIIIFADKMKAEKVEKTLFHENLHKLFNHGAHKDLLDKFYESAKDDENFSKWKDISDKYNESERHEEFFVYVVSNKMKEGNLEDVLVHLSAEEQNELFDIINTIGYEYEQERHRRASQAGRRGGRYSMRNSDVQRMGGRETQEKGSQEENGANGAGKEGVEDDNLYRSVDEVEGMADDTARWLYEKSVKGNAYRFQEGFQDAMLSLKKLQEAIVKQVGGKLEEWEDAYTAENQMSSRDTSEIENFMFNHFKPMMDAVAKFLRRTGLSYEELRTYLFAKSGLERNRDFAVRDAIAQREKDGDDVTGIYEAYLQRKQELLQDLKDGTITFREYCEEMDNEAMMIAPDLMGRDYSGLSSLFGEDTFTEDAISEVEQVENLANTDALWNAIKGATQFSLDRAKQSGVMSTDVHKKLSEMFEWYIPMRGWSETKARDVYDYFGRQEGVFNPTIKNAYGRKSLADDPLATIANMAESSIFQGNKNQVKQKLLNLAFDKPTNLITVMDSWIENKGTEDDPRWEYVYPPIEQDDDADVIAAKIKQFEEEMEQKKDAGVAKKLRGKADIPYIATPKEIAEHIIRVKRNGREFVMIINGNPRAAQAINGETNPETYNGIIEQVSRRLNRFMAAAFTTKNPTFIMRNLSRDLIFSNTAVAIKESNAYGKKFRGNQMKVLGNMRGLMKRYQSGKLDMNNPLDKMFQEFIQNGGETGFAQLTSVDEYKKKIQRELKDAKNRGKKISGKKVGRAVMDTIEFYNRCAEDVSRFTVYMTSRQMGRSIQRSVSDAKEITVNFNKRGSGSKAGGFIGFGAQSMRSLYLFFNAAVQALVNFKRLGQKHPIAFTTALSMYAVSGFLMPVVNEFLSSVLGGDDDDYENLPEWVRRNNLVISLGKWGGDAMFFTVPLPIEMRAFYGLGETSNQLLAGNVRGKDAAIQIAGQFAEMLPLNFVTDSAGPFNAFTPDAFKPIAQAYVSNKDWTGKPIYRDNGFNKELPEWTKAYAGTSKWLVNSAELLNELTGGDKYKSGVVDINPARLEHLFTGYLGGFGDMFLGGYKTISMLWDEDYRNVRNTPVLKAFLNQSDERTSYYQVKKDYASFKDEYEDTVRRLNGYERELKQPETALEYAERMDFLQRSPQIKRYEVMKTYEKELNKLYKEMKEFPDPEVQKAITTTINQIKSDAVTILREIK